MVKNGDIAPPFDLEGTGGANVKLSDFAGKPVVVFFYPKDNTPGCTREAIAFSKMLDEFRGIGASVVGISKDSIKSHCGFRDKHGLKIVLLSDPDLTTHKAYGAWGEKTMYGKKTQGTIRSTFVVGADGHIKEAFRSVKVDGHAEAVLATLTKLVAAQTDGKVGHEAKPPAK
jgi:peroxiredoxin Q/BCP